MQYKEYEKRQLQIYLSNIMKENRKTVISIKEIIYTTIAIIIFALTANLFRCDANAEIAQSKNVLNDEEKSVVQVSELNETNTLDITSRGQAIARENAKENTNGDNIVEPVLQEEQQIKYKTIEEVVISKDMDLTIRTGLSKEDFKTLISTVKEDSSKFFYNNVDII